MKASLQAFIRGLSELRIHLAIIESEKRLFGIVLGLQDKSLVEAELAALAEQAGAGGFKKRFDYNSVIVALYGFFEQFVEGLLKGYLRRLSATSGNYTDLPESIRANHVDVTAVLLKAADLQKYRGVVTPEELTANLHSCFTNQSPFSLNVDAFAHHSSNFRAGVVDRFFGRVGVQNISQRAVQLASFQDFLLKRVPPRAGLTIDQGCLFEIDDLAERRNEVAHGSESELLSNKILLDYVSSVEAYGASLYEILCCEALAFEAGLHGKQLGTTLVVHNHSIICINVSDHRASVKKGDVLVTLLDTGPVPAVGGEIISIGLDKEQIEAITCLEPIDIAFKVCFRAKENQIFQLLTR